MAPVLNLVVSMTAASLLRALSVPGYNGLPRTTLGKRALDAPL